MLPHETRIEQMCKTMVAETWVQSADFPEELSEYVFHITRQFILGYLNFLRQKEDRPQDWFPESFSIDPSLVDDMRHFFSDYQHITNAFLTLNRQLNELRKIDREKEPKLYQHMVAEIIAGMQS